MKTILINMVFNKGQIFKSETPEGMKKKDKFLSIKFEKSFILLIEIILNINNNNSINIPIIVAGIKLTNLLFIIIPKKYIKNIIEAWLKYFNDASQ